MIYALERASEDDRARLRQIVALKDASAADIDEARAIIERCGAREYTRERAHA